MATRSNAGARIARRGLALMLCLIASDSLAGLPSPRSSTIDPRLVFCPDGDITFHVTPRYLSGALGGPGEVATLDFCSSSGWVFCADGQPSSLTITNGCRVATTIGFGDNGYTQDSTARFALKAGGATSDSTVTLRVDGQFYQRFFLSSPDQNDDSFVDARDAVILRSKLGTHDLTADFDGDGVVTESDLAILMAHMGHGCARPTPAMQPSWGVLKIRYR